jgi:hypothetical protein
VVGDSAEFFEPISGHDPVHWGTLPSLQIAKVQKVVLGDQDLAVV